ncbi:MAG: hypothetical protein WAO35_23210 [Terriglobia bacterium]
MIAMLCRNRVANFTKWKGIFDSHAQAHRNAGLHLKNVWRGVEETNNVFFVFEVTDLKKARAFISNPAAAEAGKTSGILNGEYHFLETSTGY